MYEFNLYINPDMWRVWSMWCTLASWITGHSWFLIKINKILNCRIILGSSVHESHILFKHEIHLYHLYYHTWRYFQRLQHFIHYCWCKFCSFSLTQFFFFSASLVVRLLAIRRKVLASNLDSSMYVWIELDCTINRGPGLFGPCVQMMTVVSGASQLFKYLREHFLILFILYHIFKMVNECMYRNCISCEYVSLHIPYI